MKTIDDSLKQFIIEDSYKVAVLKGDWGIGKTHFWREFYKNNKENIKFKAYSYVSLFGAKNIGDLKKQIFSNFEMIDKEGLSNHLTKLKSATSIFENINLPYLKNSSAITDLIDSKFVKDFLICIDDLERKEDSISISSILGLISNLKEDRNCKILLIYNDKELNSIAKKDIEEYREKVVDLELTYNPSINENLSIIWPNGCDLYIKKIFEGLNLNNIRIMQKVKWSLHFFETLLNKKYPTIIESFNVHVVILTIIHHAYSKHLSLESAISNNYYSLIMKADEKKINKFDVIKKSKFITRDFDKIIVHYLNEGYVDFDKYKHLLDKENNTDIKNKANEKLFEAWSKYHKNFITTQEEFINQQVNLLNENINHIGVKDVENIVKFINQLDNKQDLSRYLDESIDIFIENLENKEINSINQASLGAGLSEKIKEKIEKNPKLYSISELLVSLAGSNSWNPRKIEHLVGFSENDYYEWITTEENEDVIELLAEFIDRFGNGNGIEKLVIKKINLALSKVKKRSLIDKYRVENLIERNT